MYASGDYKALLAKVDAAEKAAKVQDDQIAKQIALLDDQRAALGDAFKDARGKIGSLVYQYEVTPASDKSAKAARKKELEDAETGKSITGKLIGRSATEKSRKTSRSPATSSTTFSPASSRNAPHSSASAAMWTSPRKKRATL